MSQVISTSTQVDGKVVPLIVKVRRRVEDRLRKATEEEIIAAAKLLKVRTTE